VFRGIASVFLAVTILFSYHAPEQRADAAVQVAASPNQIARAWAHYQPLCPPCGPQVSVFEQYGLQSIERQGTGTVQVRFGGAARPSNANYIVLASNMQGSNAVSVFTKTTDGFWLSTGACECVVTFVVFGGE